MLIEHEQLRSRERGVRERGGCGNMDRVVEPYFCKLNVTTFQLIVNLQEFGYVGIFANRYSKYDIFDKFPIFFYMCL